jgi:hypothetical protein
MEEYSNHATYNSFQKKNVLQYWNSVHSISLVLILPTEDAHLLLYKSNVLITQKTSHAKGMYISWLQATAAKRMRTAFFCFLVNEQRDAQIPFYVFIFYL